jgi:hypothetical protein
MASQAGSWRGFLRLWFLLFFAYVLLKLLFDLSVGGYLDLRTVALIGDVGIPFGQAVIFWVVTRRGRVQRAAAL